MNKNTTGKTRTRSVWAAILSVIVVITALLVWDSFRSAKSMSTAAASDEDVFIHATPGDIVKVVLEIENSSTEGSIRGKLLQKETEKIYLRTNTQVTAQSGAQTKIVMGKQSDIHPAAVVHVTGVLKKDRSVDVSQIVILTGYVEIK
jgi:glycerol-3-phosphate responsive antiterminator